MSINGTSPGLTLENLHLKNYAKTGVLITSAEGAEELTQDVFLTAWRKAARFDASRGRLSTWLMAIAHNLAVDRLRRENGAGRPTLRWQDWHLPSR